MKMKIRVGLVDDHLLFLEGLSTMLETLQDFEVMVQAVNGLDLQHKLENQRDLPDLMIVDTDMPVMDGLETTVWLKQYYPSIKLIVISMDDKDGVIIKMLKAGCCAYLFKTVYPETAKKALHQVYTKGYFNPDKVQSISWPIFGKANKEESITLTNEEQHFLQLACSELSYELIVDEMNVSERTANRYIDSLYKKFGVQSRLGLVLEALRKEFALPKG